MVRVDDEYMTEKESRVVYNKFIPLLPLYNCSDYNSSKIKPDNFFLTQNFVKILTARIYNPPA